MTNNRSLAGRERLRNAALIAAAVWALTAFGGLVLFLAGSRLAQLDVASALAAFPFAPPGLASAGPLGYAAWMCLLMAAGSPIVAAAVFAMVYLGERPGQPE